MSAEIKVEVTGVREALRTLGRIDKDQRREAVKQLKLAGAPMVQVARLQYPLRAPLSGMANSGRLGYQPGRVKQQVSIKVGGKQPPQRDRYPVITLQQTNAAAQLFSMAGMRNNAFSRATNSGQRQFSQLLANRWGKPQRGLWKQVRLIRTLAKTSLNAAVKDVIQSANRELAR
jgi:hypothetical protein